MTILYFVIALSILVIAHEWGHFIVARLNKIRVLKFSVGFGPKLFSTTKGDTEYRVSLIPLGGYVQLYGEDPEAEAHGDSTAMQAIQSSPDAFSQKPLFARSLTVLAGPTMNIFLALLFMPLAFMIGRMVPDFMDQPPVVMGVEEQSPAFDAGLKVGDRLVAIQGASVQDWEEVLNWIITHPETQTRLTIEREGTVQEVAIKTALSPVTRQKMGYLGIEPYYFWKDDPIIGGFAPDSPARQAGLQENDRILSINGQKIATWTEMTQTIRAGNGDSISLEIERGGEKQSITIQPRFDEKNKIWLLGVTKFEDPTRYIRKQYPLAEALREGTRENLKLLRLTGDVIWQLVTFQLSYKTLGGPVQIAQATAQAARSGLGDFFYFLAFLSMQLGILNLLPIPVLDGGHLFFMVIEGIRKKPVSLKIRSISQQVGLALLLTLMVLVTANDIDSVWGFANIWGKIKGFF